MIKCTRLWKLFGKLWSFLLFCDVIDAHRPLELMHLMDTVDDWAGRPFDFHHALSSLSPDSTSQYNSWVIGGSIATRVFWEEGVRGNGYIYLRWQDRPDLDIVQVKITLRVLDKQQDGI